METEGEADPNVKADIEVVVEKWIRKYGDGMEANKEVVTKFTDLTLNYIYFLVNESDQIAELKGHQNITGEHVKLAVENTETRINAVTDDQVEDALRAFQNVKTHALNTDDSQIISHRESQDPGEHLAESVQASARQCRLQGRQERQVFEGDCDQRQPQKAEDRLICCPFETFFILSARSVNARPNKFENANRP